MVLKSDYRLMRSINFEFLRSKWPELAGLGGFAEAYAHPDPVGSISNLNCAPRSNTNASTSVLSGCDIIT